MRKHNRFSTIWLVMALVGTLSLMFVGCAPSPEPEEEAPEAEAPAEAPPEEQPEAAAEESLLNPSALDEKAPATYMVQLDTTKGDVKIQVDRSWAPRGADRFYNLVKNGYYDKVPIFRVVKGFVVQFGIHGDPAVNEAWQNATIPDDPVIRTNRKGTLTFATSGVNSRTTQVFINLRANQNLDAQGFAPFGRVVEGMEVVESWYSGYGDAAGMNQDNLRSRGNAYVKKTYPNMDYIEKATIVSS